MHCDLSLNVCFVFKPEYCVVTVASLLVMNGARLIVCVQFTLLLVYFNSKSHSHILSYDIGGRPEYACM